MSPALASLFSSTSSLLLRLLSAIPLYLWLTQFPGLIHPAVVRQPMERQTDWQTQRHIHKLAWIPMLCPPTQVLCLHSSTHTHTHTHTQSLIHCNRLGCSASTTSHLPLCNLWWGADLRNPSCRKKYEATLRRAIAEDEDLAAYPFVWVQHDWMTRAILQEVYLEISNDRSIWWDWIL